MRSVHRRLAKLEDGSGPCSVCSLDPNGKVRYIVHWDWEDEDESSESSPPCPRCGQRAIIVVSWPDPPGSSEERARLEAQHEEALAARPWLGGEDAEPPNAEPVPDTRRGPEGGRVQAMSLCSGIRADGGHCRAQAMRNSEWCINHDPDQAEVRRRRASKGGKRGGRGRPLVELTAVKRQLRELADNVITGRTDRGNAAVAGQLLGTFLRAVSVELKVREQDEILQRLDALESAARHSDGRGRTWG